LSEVRRVPNNRARMAIVDHPPHTTVHPGPHTAVQANQRDHLDKTIVYSLPKVPHPSRVERVPSTAKLPTDRQSVVSVLDAHNRPL
jgi:hypothetical protein